ncbi:MAG: hypothetical protein ACI4KL_04820 [Lentihominibacter sp.]
MRAIGILFFMWAVGYFVAMNITVKGLPMGPLFLLMAAGVFCYSMGEMKDRNKRN